MGLYWEKIHISLLLKLYDSEVDCDESRCILKSPEKPLRKEPLKRVKMTML